MADRNHLSIGEVLTLLQADFPDVTISKIRFLESQGLLDPERTPSGYRKFYDADIGRLRWILRQQRENFLPLKVIKDRLASGEVDFDETGALVTTPAGTAAGAAAGAAPDAVGPDPATAAPEPAAAAATETPAAPAAKDAATPPATDTAADDASDEGATGHGATDDRRRAAALLQEPPTPRAAHAKDTAPTTPKATAPTAAPLFDVGATAVNLTLEELTAATGLTNREIGDLERYGLLKARTLGATSYYDEDALLVARVAAKFKVHGIEARHLRMYRVAAEREAGVFEQLITPIVRKRGPQARRDATELLNELAALGNGLRAAMLRELLRDYVDGA